MALSTSRRCTQKPSRPASWITTTLTARPSRRSAVSRSLPSSASRPGPSPAVTTRFEIRSSPGELVATSQDLRLSSSATNTVLSSGRVSVAIGWTKSVQDSLHECDWATAFYQIGCRPHRHGICSLLWRYLLVWPQADRTEDPVLRPGLRPECFQGPAPAQIVGEIFGGDTMEAAHPFFEPIGIDVVDVKIGRLQAWLAWGRQDRDRSLKGEGNDGSAAI